MNIIGAVNYTCDSLAKQKAGQKRLAHPDRKKIEQSADIQDAQDVEYPLASDPDSMLGHLLDTSA